MQIVSARISMLHLEDDPSDAYLTQRALLHSGLSIAITHVTSRDEFVAALDAQRWDVVVSDNAVPSFTCREALEIVRNGYPHTPFIILSGAADPTEVSKRFHEGATDYVLKDHLPQLAIAIRRTVPLITDG